MQNKNEEDPSSDVSEDECNENMENLTTKWWDEKSDIISSSSDEEYSEHNSFVPEDENCELKRQIIFHYFYRIAIQMLTHNLHYNNF